MNKHNFITQGIAPNTVVIDTLVIDTVTFNIFRSISHENGERTITFANRIRAGK